MNKPLKYLLHNFEAAAVYGVALGVGLLALAFIGWLVIEIAKAIPMFFVVMLVFLIAGYVINWFDSKRSINNGN